jgi:co-chaperonin GroES (HSP10)
MKIWPLHDRVVIRRVEGDGTSKGVEGSIVVGRLMEDSDMDFNVRTGRYAEMIEIVRTAQQDTGSIPALLVKIEAMVADIPHEVRRRSPHQRHGRNELPSSA